MGLFTPRQSRGQMAQNNHAIRPPLPQYDWENTVNLLMQQPQANNIEVAAVMGLNTTQTGTTNNPILDSYRMAALQEAERRTLLGQVNQQATIPNATAKRSFNPFKRRQPGGQVGSASVGVKVMGKKLSVKEANNIARDAQDILRNHPNTTDEELMDVLNLPPLPNYEAAVATGRRAHQKEKLLSAQPKNDNNDEGVTLSPSEQSDMLKLVNYSPEQLVQHVDQSISRIQFGWSFSTKLMEGYSEIWAWMGPIILVIGTIGEVFLVLWLRQKAQEIIAGLSIVAVALVLEGTFLAVSYKAATIRNRAERRLSGPSELDKKKLRRQFYFWLALASGVCLTQVIFIAAQTNDTDIGIVGVWIFAIVRAVFTIVADGYTAFAHEEKPDDAERVLEQAEKRTKASDLLLNQKRREISIINDGILDVRAASVEAQIKDEKMTTQLTTERLQNQALIDALKTQQETAQMTIKMMSTLNRALMDPSMPSDQRQAAINTMIALGQGYSKISSVPSTTVTEEDD